KSAYRSSPVRPIDEPPVVRPGPGVPLSLIVYGSPADKGTPTARLTGVPSFPPLSNSRNVNVPAVCLNGILTSTDCNDPEGFGITPFNEVVCAPSVKVSW